MTSYLQEEQIEKGEINMDNSLAGRILTIISIMSFLIGLVSLFVKVDDNQIFRVSKKQMFAVCVMISIVSFSFSMALYELHQNEKPISTNGISTEVSTDPESEPMMQPTAEPTVQPMTEPTVQPATEPTVQPATEPTVQPTAEPIQISFYIDVYCENNPHFTSFYILVYAPDVDYAVRYDYEELPAKFEGALGTYVVHIFNLWSDQFIEEYTLEISNSIGQWDIEFNYYEQEDTDQSYFPTEVTWNFSQFPEANLNIEILDGNDFSYFETDLLIGVEGQDPMYISSFDEKEIWMEVEPLHEYTIYIKYQDWILETQNIYLAGFLDYNAYNKVIIQLP